MSINAGGYKSQTAAAAQKENYNMNPSSAAAGLTSSSTNTSSAQNNNYSGVVSSLPRSSIGRRNSSQVASEIFKSINKKHKNLF